MSKYQIVKDYYHEKDNNRREWDKCDVIDPTSGKRLLPYETTRIYDAIASFFSFINPCVAIKSTDKKMSYNKDFTKLVLTPRSMHNTCFNIKVSHKMIFTTLKDCLLKEQVNILKLYLLLNTEFINFISTRVMKEVDNGKIIKELAKEFECIRAEAFHFFQFQHIKLLAKELKKDELTKSINFIILFHPEIKEIDKEINQLKEDKKKPGSDKNAITKQIRETNKKLNTTKSNLKKEFIDEYSADSDTDLNFTLFNEGQFLKLENLYNLYKNFINVVLDEENILTKELLGELLRPLQDTVKIKHTLDNTAIQKLLNEIQVIPNPKSRHTEYNIYDEEDNNSKEDYIGVSKLCCGYCHYKLGIRSDNHRGTHGVLDAWNPEDLRNEIYIDLKERELIEEPPTIFHQHRRLSFDDFEKEIDLQQILGLDNDINLHDYKDAVLGNAVDMDLLN